MSVVGLVTRKACDGASAAFGDRLVHDLIFPET